MVFVNGRGRPPRGSSKVGVVSWEEKCFCFVGSNGFYWHGSRLGGWQKHPPDVSLENRKRPATSGRGRRPNGNERVGVDVSYNTEHDCYQTENIYFWHGTYNGGWKQYPPGTDPLSQDEEGIDDNAGGSGMEERVNPTAASSIKRQKKGNTKGRPPRCTQIGETIKYDTENLCWVTNRDEGLYWHGTYNGGWKKYPPKKH
mmetsp:Transcript_24614/g.53948  ORF Transcript_24614/g.53948 Transcript_24614/m.53948 type:complete len:200 (-) Transcript_24614:472-1071(-)